MTNEYKELQERYKSLSDFEIVSIIENETDYLPHAVELAKAELNHRNLTEEELTKVLSKVNQLKLVEQEREIRNEKRNESVRSVIATSWHLLNPSIPSAKKLVNLIILTLTYLVGELLFNLFEIWQLVPYEYFLIYFLEVLIFGLAISLLYKQNKWGWYLISFKVWNVFYMILFNLYYSIRIYHDVSQYGYDSDSGIGGMMNLILEDTFNFVGDTILLIQVILCLLLISTKVLLNHFSLSKKAIHYSLFSAVLYTLFILFGLSYLA